MNRERWNKLYSRTLAAMWRQSDDRKRVEIRRRWLAVMERDTGTTCFFMPWQ